MKKSLERVQLKSTIKITMPKDVLHKIKYLCRAISKTEWSGILLYSVKGSIKTPEKMEIILQDIIPMQKGSAAYTEYKFNEKKRDISGYEDRMIDYFNENPKALEENWRVGHIHSHNVMGVFFSGTDMEELEDNSVSHDFYLSLIVNDWMDFTAKVAFRAVANIDVPVEYEALDEEGKTYSLTGSQLKAKKEKLFVYDCVINSPENEKLLVDDTFFNSVNSIIEKAKAPVASPYNYGGAGTYPDYTKGNYPYSSSRDIGYNAFNPNYSTPRMPQVKTSKINNFTPQEKPTDIVRGFVDDIPFGDSELDDTVIEDFTIALLKNAYPTLENLVTLDNVLDGLEAMAEGFTSEGLAKNVLTNYPALYEQFFETEADDTEIFINTSDDVIDLLEEYEVYYEFLSNTIMALKSMVDKFEKHATTI